MSVEKQRRRMAMSSRMIGRWIPGRTDLTLLETAVQDINRQMAEQRARIEDATQTLRYLQQEKDSILKEAADAARARNETPRVVVVDR